MVRDLMLTCVERRFNTLRAPHPIQWLADNGSAYAARETLEFVVALALVPCFTPVRSPESNGVSEALVKILKRDYARIQPRPDALTVLEQLPAWIDDYNENHPHSGLRMRSLVNSFEANHNQPRVLFDGGNSSHRHSSIEEIVRETDGGNDRRHIRVNCAPLGEIPAADQCDSKKRQADQKDIELPRCKDHQVEDDCQEGQC
jgi:hypothetical protein